MKVEFPGSLLVRIEDDNAATLITAFRFVVDGREWCAPRGFQTDFASVPRLPFAYWLFGGRARKAAVAHDYLYSGTDAPREYADAVFLAAMAATGQPWYRRALMWLGVRLGGGFVRK